MPWIAIFESLACHNAMGLRGSHIEKIRVHALKTTVTVYNFCCSCLLGGNVDSHCALYPITHSAYHCSIHTSTYRTAFPVTACNVSDTVLRL